MELNRVISEEQVSEEWDHQIKESRKEAGFIRVGFSYVDFQMTFCEKCP